MIEIRTKLQGAGTAHGIELAGTLALPFELRERSRLRTKLESGEAVALLLPRGEILRGGDVLVSEDGRAVEVVAAPEQVVHIECNDAAALTRAAYHLGNRHVPVQVGNGFLRIGADHVLEDMLRGLGARLTAMRAPFEPEAGAYGGGHSHGAHTHGEDHANHGHEAGNAHTHPGHQHPYADHDDAQDHGGRIHEYGAHATADSHESR